MKIEVLQENLHTALSYIHKVIPSKPSIQVLSGVLLHASDTEVFVAATDLQIGIKSPLLADVITHGSIVIPAKTLTEIIFSLPPGKIILEVVEGILHISSSAGKTKIQCQMSEEYPEFPSLSESVQSISMETITQAQRMVGFAPSIDPSRPVLTSVLFRKKEGWLQIVGTDGFRLALMSLESSIELEKDILLPTRALQEIVRIGVQEKVSEIRFSVSEELKQLLFIVNGITIFIRLIEGEYPPFEKIIPGSFTTEVVFDAVEMLSHIKRALVFARESSNIIRLTFNEEGITCSSSSSSSGGYSGTQRHEAFSGVGGSIAFNARYLQEFISTVKPEKIWFGMSESLKPAVLRPEGMQEYLYVVMPFRVNQ